MKYLGYALIIGVFGTGYVGFHPAAILIAAILSTVIYVSARRQALKSQPQAPDQNMVLDGAFLLAGQVLIMFTAYILGWFLANLGTPSGMMGRTLSAFVVIGVVGSFIGLIARRNDKMR